MSRRLPRVEVEWHDSVSRGGWDTKDAHRKRNAIGPMFSIGYLLTKSRRVVQLAQSESTMNGDVNDTITIPRVAVVRIKSLTGGCQKKRAKS